jgi:hypothetical protein
MRRHHPVSACRQPGQQRHSVDPLAAERFVRQAAEDERGRAAALGGASNAVIVLSFARQLEREVLAKVARHLSTGFAPGEQRGDGVVGVR